MVKIKPRLVGHTLDHVDFPRWDLEELELLDFSYQIFGIVFSEQPPRYRLFLFLA